MDVANHELYTRPPENRYNSEKPNDDNKKKGKKRKK